MQDFNNYENINRIFIQKLGISYDEFSSLDLDEQQHLLRKYHQNHPDKSDKTLVMISGGDESIFMMVPKKNKIKSNAKAFMDNFMDKLKNNELKIEKLPQENGENITQEFVSEQIKKYQDLLDTGIIDEAAKEEQGLTLVRKK